MGRVEKEQLRWKAIRRWNAFKVSENLKEKKLCWIFSSIDIDVNNDVKLFLSADMTMLTMRVENVMHFLIRNDTHMFQITFYCQLINDAWEIWIT